MPQNYSLDDNPDERVNSNKVTCKKQNVIIIENPKKSNNHFWQAVKKKLKLRPSCILAKIGMLVEQQGEVPHPADKLFDTFVFFFIFFFFFTSCIADIEKTRRGAAPRCATDYLTIAGQR